LPAAPNFPEGELQVVSSSLRVFTFFITCNQYENIVVARFEVHLNF
jgi:hypothetical protein